MNADETGYAIYLVALGGVVLTWFFAQNRNRLSTTMQQAAIWSLIFLGAIVIFGFKDQLQRQLFPSQAVMSQSGIIELGREADGHFYAQIDVNGVEVSFLIDTGATEIVLSAHDARAVGIDPDNLPFTGTASTANGDVRTARVTLETLTLGTHTDRSVSAWVSDGALDISLLGQRYLSRFAKLEITGDVLRLTP